MRTQVGRWEYEIDENNVISAWYLDNLNSDVEGCPPNLRQPHNPDGTPFADYEAAKNWIESHLNSWAAAVAAAEEAEEAQTEEPAVEVQ